MNLLKRRTIPMKTMKQLFVLCLITLVAGAPAYAKSSKTMQIKGSDTMVNLGQAWAEEYMRLNPDASIAVTGGGSGTGISAIISGTCDLAQSSREMKEKELKLAEDAGSKVTQVVAGLDGIAVIVHSSNPLESITIEQLSDIFSGKVKNWKEIGGEDRPFLALSRERNSGTHVFFLEEVVRKGNSKGPEEFSEEALMMPSNQAIVQEVKSSESGIGYVGIGYVSGDVKVLTVSKDASSEAVTPTLETVQDGTYPISRELFFYVKGEQQEGIVKDYIDYVLSDEGQEILQLLDFVPLAKKE